MYRRILVPVDGSATSTLGLKQALGLAQDQRARVRDDGSRLLELPQGERVERAHGRVRPARDVFVDIDDKGVHEVLEILVEAKQGSGLRHDHQLRHAACGYDQ